MRRLIILSLLALACDGPESNAPPFRGVAEPGTSYSLSALVMTQSGGQAVTWSVVEPDGGTIDASGVYTAPTCTVVTSAYTADQLLTIGALTGTAHVLATWTGGSLTIAIPVSESFLGVRINPVSPAATFGGSVTFKAYNEYTCHEALAP